MDPFDLDTEINLLFDEIAAREARAECILAADQFLADTRPLLKAVADQLSAAISAKKWFLAGLLAQQAGRVGTSFLGAELVQNITELQQVVGIALENEVGLAELEGEVCKILEHRQAPVNRVVQNCSALIHGCGNLCDEIVRQSKIITKILNDVRT